MSNIVIVNDSPFIIEIFSAILEREGYHVFGTYSSKECLELLERTTPDLILSNINRDEMDGWEFTQQIKGNPKTKNIPIVITSAREYTHRDLQQYGHLIEEYVLLPAGKERLIEVIERVMQNVDAKTG
jgi:CheY-like chemotaxis protein